MKTLITPTEIVRVLEPHMTPETYLEETVDSGAVKDEPFFVMNVDDIIQKFETWKETLPTVKPFYAVKCNDTPLVLQLLAGLGAGFDCASKAEIAAVLALGVEPERIIFANPVKMTSHIKYAAHFGVDLMTFDNISELQKVKAAHPSPRLVLRIRQDADDAQCPLGAKFGAELDQVEELLRAAAQLGLPVVGVSFHVGSGAREFDCFRKAIRNAANVINLGREFGFEMSLLDIGGGFPGDSGTSLGPVGDVIKSTLAEVFPRGDVQVIAEPGRFFVSSAYVLATAIHGLREKDVPMYYINDGVYGSFNILLYDHAVKVPTPLKISNGPLIRSQVWGPTCDSLDLVADGCLLPPLAVGDWLLFKDMGAYTIPTSSPFNGFPLPKVHYVISQAAWSQVKDLLSLTVEAYGGVKPTPPPQAESDEKRRPSVPFLAHPYLIELLTTNTPA